MKSSWFLVAIVTVGVARCLAQESVPGDRHAQVREQLASGEPAAAIDTLNAILGTEPQDAEAMALLGTAYELAGDTDAAWRELDRARRTERELGTGDPALMAYLLRAADRCNGTLQAALAARESAVSELARGIDAALSVGDDETARLAAVAISRIDPAHERANLCLQSLTSDPTLGGRWRRLFTPSHVGNYVRSGTWRPLVSEEGYLGQSSPALHGVAVYELGLPRPSGAWQLEFEAVVEEAEKGESASGFVIGLVNDGDEDMLAFFGEPPALMHDRINSARSMGSKRYATVEGHAAGQPIRVRLDVVDSRVRVLAGGVELGSFDGIYNPARTVSIRTQHARVRFVNLRFRTRLSDGPLPDRDGVRALERSIRRKDPDCLTLVDSALAGCPNEPELLMLRARPVDALQRPRCADDGEDNGAAPGRAQRRAELQPTPCLRRHPLLRGAAQDAQVLAGVP